MLYDFESRWMDAKPSKKAVLVLGDATHFSSNHCLRAAAPSPSCTSIYAILAFDGYHQAVISEGAQITLPFTLSVHFVFRKRDVLVVDRDPDINCDLP
jgi:hypothetical protein